MFGYQTPIVLASGTLKMHQGQVSCTTVQAFAERGGEASNYSGGWNTKHVQYLIGQSNTDTK